jgi:hypothetical protein
MSLDKIRDESALQDDSADGVGNQVDVCMQQIADGAKDVHSRWRQVFK